MKKFRRILLHSRGLRNHNKPKLEQSRNFGQLCSSMFSAVIPSSDRERIKRVKILKENSEWCFEITTKLNLNIIYILSTPQKMNSLFVYPSVYSTRAL